MNASTEPYGAEHDPAELEREASEIRADMDRTLDALERKLSPSQLLDRSLGYLREHGAEWTQTIGDTLRRNPVPILMAVAGVTWLIGSGIAARRHGGGRGADPAGAREHSSIHDRVAATRERIRTSRAAATNKMSQAMDATRAQTQRAQDRMHSLVDEQPLVLGALAVAIGAIIGAALPSSEYENRTVGQVRDRALERARQAGERQYQNLRSKLETH